MRWCGPEVEVEGIVSVKTGGCPEDCHFCSQSGRFETPVRAARLDIPSLVQAARQTAADRRHRVLHRRGRAWARRAVDGPGPRRESPRSRTRSRSTSRARWASSPASRARSSPSSACTATTTTSRPRARYFPQVVTTHTWEERWDTLAAGARARDGGVLRRRSSGWARRSSSAPSSPPQLAELDPDEVPLNFLDPRPGTPFASWSRSTRPTRCARSRRSGSRCREPCCGSPAAAS